MKKQAEIVILGAGPGGYVAAIRAAQLGLKPILIEKAHLGGICLNWGCIPTKALLKSAEVYENIKHAAGFGIVVEGVKFDFTQMIARSRAVAEKLSSGIKQLLKANNVEVLNGHGKITKNKVVIVEHEGATIAEIACKNIIIATGARARTLPGIEPDNKGIWSYKEAMLPSSLPKSIIVMGSGAIGLEFASFYKALGVEVKVIEMFSRIMPNEDHEIAALAHKAFEKRGIEIITNAKVKKVEYKDNNLRALIEQNGTTKELQAEKLISAVGIVANIENIGLEENKIEIERGFIKTNKYLQTSHEGIYAIGDVTSPPWLAHKASHEAVIAVEKIAGLSPHTINPQNIPACTYCTPQIASIGLTEEKAKEQKIAIKVGRFPFAANGKAIAMNEDGGMVKMIFCEKTGEILGAHMIGSEVTEMIQGLSIAKTMEGTELDLMHTIFPHPTISETIHEATLDAFKKALHIKSS